MTATDVIGYLVTALGAGGLSAIVSKAIDARRERRARDADLAERAFDAFEHGREDTERHVAGWTECERRCAKLEAENALLRERIESLEHEVDWMRRMITALNEGNTNTAPKLVGGKKA